MKFPVQGSSPVTDYQLIKFTKANGNYNEDILAYYIEYSLKYNIQVDLAYIMCLLYTDFFKNPIEGNNIAGIGLQFGGTILETFKSIEECVKAHCEALSKCVNKEFNGDGLYSNLIRRIEAGSLNTREEIFESWNYGELTKYTIYDMNTFTLELQRTRNYDVDWSEGTTFYYYIRIKTDPSRTKIVKLRSEIKDKGFDEKLMNITAEGGKYSLEMGRYANPAHTTSLLNNLKIYGYSGEICFRRK